MVEVIGVVALYLQHADDPVCSDDRQHEMAGTGARGFDLAISLHHVQHVRERRLKSSPRRCGRVGNDEKMRVLRRAHQQRATFIGNETVE